MVLSIRREKEWKSKGLGFVIPMPCLGLGKIFKHNGRKFIIKNYRTTSGPLRDKVANKSLYRHKSSEWVKLFSSTGTNSSKIHILRKIVAHSLKI